MHVGEHLRDGDRMTLLYAVSMTGAGIGPGVDQVPYAVQQVQVLSIHVQRMQRRNFMPGKFACSDLGGIYLRHGGRVIHVHIVCQLLDGKAPALCLQPPHAVMKTTGNPAWLFPGCAQVKQAAEPFYVFRVIR